MAVIFSTHLVSVKCKVFTTTTTREIVYYYYYQGNTAVRSASNPADAFPLLLANHVRESIAHVRRFK